MRLQLRLWGLPEARGFNDLQRDGVEPPRMFPSGAADPQAPARAMDDQPVKAVLGRLRSVGGGRSDVAAWMRMIAADDRQTRRSGVARRGELIGRRDREAARRLRRDIRQRERIADRIAAAEQQTAYFARVGGGLGGETI